MGTARPTKKFRPLRDLDFLTAVKQGMVTRSKTWSRGNRNATPQNERKKTKQNLKNGDFLP